MLTYEQMSNTRKELQENFKRLGEDKRKVLADLNISECELEAALNMKDTDPVIVWWLRDYLVNNLEQKGIEVYPFTFLTDEVAEEIKFML